MTMDLSQSAYLYSFFSHHSTSFIALNTKCIAAQLTMFSVALCSLLPKTFVAGKISLCPEDSHCYCNFLPKMPPIESNSRSLGADVQMSNLDGLYVDPIDPNLQLYNACHWVWARLTYPPLLSTSPSSPTPHHHSLPTPPPNGTTNTPLIPNRPVA